jgi:His/Glu/Gln/Arg/opine family amino acid ABC transporter permease subunit
MSGIMESLDAFFESWGLDPIWNNLPRFMSGTLLTVEITALSVALGLVLAVPLALARVSFNPVLRVPVYCYILYFRGTPLLVQLFLIYYGSGQFRDTLENAGLWLFFREPYFCAVLALTLNTAAYTAEILRGSIQAVPIGEVEAARSCGMSRALVYRRIILPKAARLALPAYSNEVIFLFQATSLVSIITLMDLTGVGRVIISRSFRTFEVWIFVGLIYLAVTYLIAWIFSKVEYRLMGHLRASPDHTTRGAARPDTAIAVR